MTCLKCNANKYAKGLCRYHYAIEHPLKRTQIVKKPYKINQVSKTRSKQMKIYGHIRKDFLDDHPYCEARIPGCTIMATSVHHKLGRMNHKLNDTSEFLATCLSCHQWVEENPRKAKELGFSKNRLTI